jgi:hypothetical protein
MGPHSTATATVFRAILRVLVRLAVWLTWRLSGRSTVGGMGTGTGVGRAEDGVDSVDSVECVDTHTYDHGITARVRARPRPRTRTWADWLGRRQHQRHHQADHADHTDDGRPPLLREYTLRRRAAGGNASNALHAPHAPHAEVLLTYAASPPATLPARTRRSQRLLLDATLDGARHDISAYLNARLPSFDAARLAAPADGLTLSQVLRAMHASGRIARAPYLAALRAGPVLRTTDADLRTREFGGGEALLW